MILDFNNATEPGNSSSKFSLPRDLLWESNRQLSILDVTFAFGKRVLRFIGVLLQENLKTY